ncbi:ankyrin repeat-containing domain protein [Diaporthe sp. PMI_573]|nr:ankyrin repeat-containing domain protein [Diaporthaceae sp. PMI_573]
MTQSVSPLQAATLRGEERIIRYLLEKGADVNCPARSSCGVTPLQAICFACDLRRTTKIEIVKLFLEHGANVNAAPAWNLGLSALQAAAFVGDLEVAKLLVSRDADVNAPACKYGGGTALALAARQGHKAMVRYLLEVGAAIPAAGITISSFGKTFEDHKRILHLLHISSSELAAKYGGNGTPSRDYREYEVKWKDDPTYQNKD